MRNGRDNIFSNVVTLENQTTELLKNFLQFKQFRDAFLSIFLRNDRLIANVTSDRIITQKFLHEYGTPDLCIESEELIVLIEVKINDTGLTANQPHGYLKYLMSQESGIEKWLVFLVPNDYHHLTQIESAFQIHITQHNIENINLQIITWQDVINVINTEELSQFSSYVSEFHEFLKLQFEPKTIVFEQMEVSMVYSNQLPKALKKLFDVIDAVKNKITKFQSSAAAGRYEYGCYFKDSDTKPILFFGVWYDFWQEHNYPLCLAVDLKKYDKTIIERFSKLFSDKCKDFQDWRVVGIDSDKMLEPDNISIISKYIVEALDKLNE